jgi:hypothetical protein
VAGCWSGSTRSTGDRDKWLSCGTWGLTQTGPTSEEDWWRVETVLLGAGAGPLA